MSSGERLRAASVAAAVIAAALVWPARSPACGPWFPVTILVEPDFAVTHPPNADYVLEVRRIAAPWKPRFRTVAPKGSRADQTHRADLADLRRALAQTGLTADEQKELLGQYTAARSEVRRYHAAVAQWKRDNIWRGENEKKPRPVRPKVAVPHGLPAEFALYLRGALAYHQGRRREATALWQKLLALPPKQRRYRSTWAAFMIGRTCPDADAALAAKWFAQVRKLATAGYADSLGLAAASYGWQARAELLQKHYVRAIELYLVHQASGDPTAAMSLRVATGRLLEAKPPEFQAAARNEHARQVVTAFFVAQGGPSRAERYLGLNGRWDRVLAAWLKAAEAVAAKEVPGSSRLAWAAYQAADLRAARRWLKLAPVADPIAGWIQAKLLLRQGKLDAAAGVLARVARALPGQEVWKELAMDGEYARRGQVLGEISPRWRVQGELAALRMARRQYVEALDLLVRSRYWEDAAYVAERVLTPRELQAYVDRNWSEPRKVERDPTTWRRSDTDLARDVRWVLARRLTRIGQWKLARKYYPPAYRPRLDAYIQGIRGGHNRKRSKVQRGRLFWQAAKIARWEGIDLLGTEVEPDWHCYDGQFECTARSEVRLAAEGQPLLVPVAADEKQRLRRHQMPNEQRWHYRDVAAGHAWSAAGLMPDQSNETADILCRAGRWLMAAEPKKADKFYKALVRRCGKTALGREADRRRWFPRVKPDPTDAPRRRGPGSQYQE